MKLILCSICNETFSLSHTYKECKGGHGGGQYIDNVNAKVWGLKDKVFVLGFTNSSLTAALRGQITGGDLPPKGMSGYGIVSPGREFTAFVIPESAPTVDRVSERFIPVDCPKPWY